MQAELAAAQWQDVRRLGQAAGLRVRAGGSRGAWLPVDELRDAILKHLAPQAMAVLNEFYQTCFGTASRALLG